MHTQLLGGVVVEQVVCHRGLYAARAGGFLVQEQYMVIRDDVRQLEFTLGRVKGLFLGGLLRHPHGGLGDAVEVDVVLSDELVHGRILAAPVVLPFLTASALFFEVGLSE